MILPINKTSFNEINTCINKIKDNQLRLILNKFINSKEIVEFMSSQSTIRRNCFLVIHNFLNLLINQIQKCEQINWQSYCKLIHSVKQIKSNIRNASHNCNLIRKIISMFYLYVINELECLSNLKQYLHLYISYEMQDYDRDNMNLDDNCLQNIRTNFPINNKENEIIQLEVETSENNYQIINLNINSDNDYLHNLIKLFITNLDGNVKKAIHKTEGRLFFYYFSQSLKDKIFTISNLTDFNFHIYTVQLKLLIDINNKFNISTRNSMSLVLLKRFYLFIDDLYKKQNGEYLFQDKIFNREFILNNQFTKYLYENYEIVYRNPFDEVPKSDIWLLLSDKFNANSNGDNNVTLKFNEICNIELKEDLKHYIWHKNCNDSSLKKIVLRVTDFIQQYDRYKDKIININENYEYFPNDFILQYRAYLESSNVESKDSYINDTLNAIKGYLEYYSDKYHVTKLKLNYFKKKQLEYNGGNPIAKEDFEKISQEFVNKIKSTTDGELFFIIFKLASTTKLRLGEILNLERNCIVSINENQNYGEIKYISKTSDGQKIKDIFLIDDIKLIQKAISLTSGLTNMASNKLKNYIFISLNKVHKMNVVKISNQFQKHFKLVVNNLIKNKKLTNYYVPYNARHTFIHQAWEAVEDNLISNVEIGIVTGNTANIASKHYRKHQIHKYIESTYMISIGDVNINGEILNDNSIVDDLPQVEYGSGACNSPECIKIDTNEDSDYKCLVCNKFVTSIGRVDIFEKRVNYYRNKVETSNSVVETNYYQGLLELYATYLSEIYKVIEGD